MIPESESKPGIIISVVQYILCRRSRVTQSFSGDFGSSGIDMRSWLLLHSGLFYRLKKEKNDFSNCMFNLRPEMGNIFLFINVQDFLDSMVIRILGTKRIYTK